MVEIKLPTFEQVEEIKNNKSNNSIVQVSTFRPTPLRPNSSLNTSNTSFVISHTTNDGVCYGSSGNNVLKSIDYGKTTTTITNIAGTIVPNISWVLKTNKGNIVVGLFNNDTQIGEIWSSDDNETNFIKVLDFETPKAKPSATFGYSIYNNIILVQEYGQEKTAPNNPRRLYMSTNYGKTFKKIYEIDNITGVHPHDVQYDPYEDIIWCVTGDGVENRKVRYSVDRGVTWNVVLHPEVQFTSVSVLPNCILFGTDTLLKVGFYKLDRPKTGLRTATITGDMIKEAYLQTKSHPQMPIGCKSFSDTINGVVYASFYETYPYVTIPATVYATKNGIDYYIVWQSDEETVVSGGGCGVLAMAGIDYKNNKLLAYVRMNLTGTSTANHTLCLDLPSWTIS